MVDDFDYETCYLDCRARLWWARNDYELKATRNE